MRGLMRGCSESWASLGRKKIEAVSAYLLKTEREGDEVHPLQWRANRCGSVWPGR